MSTTPVYLITGAGSGFGEALALELAARKVELILLDRNRRVLEQLHDDIATRFGIQPALYPMNLAGATPDDYANLADTINKEFGKLDALIHNAAHFQGLRPLENTKPLDWFEAIQVNLNAPFLLSQQCARLLRCSPFARMVYITDDFSRTGWAYRGAYAVAKAGLDALMHVVAAEEENTGLCVFSYNPGPMETSMLSKVYPGHKRKSLPPVADYAKELIGLMNSEKHQVHDRVMLSALAGSTSAMDSVTPLNPL